MAFQELKPMLRTWDIPGTIRFYVNVLGFQCKQFSDESSWAHFRRDNAIIMLAGPNEHAGDTAPSFTGSLCITCDDIVELWTAVKDRVKVCYPIEDFDCGMREFGVYDNNGYLLQFGTPLDDANA